MGALASDVAITGCDSAVVRCFHCGEPTDGDLEIRLHERTVTVCCAGCAAAALVIVEGGLARYYTERDAFSPRPHTVDDAALAVYDDGEFAARYVTRTGDSRRASLSVQDLRCAGCAWLIEAHLQALPGVESCSVDYVGHRIELRWNGAVVRLSRVLAALAALGYAARPTAPGERRALLAAELRARLREFGVASIFGMQVMMIAFAFYAGDIESAQAEFLRWTSLVLSLPLVTYCARPFIVGAWRALVMGTLNMDVPITAGLILAAGGSAYHTLRGQGAVYFDTVAMFVMLLLLSRYLDAALRVRAAQGLDSHAGLVPDAALRVVPRGGVEVIEPVPSTHLVPGDCVLVRPGERVPADGEIVSGTSTLDDSLLTGESRAESRGPGARILGGSTNVTSVLKMRVTNLANASFAGQLNELIEQAQALRPYVPAAQAYLARVFTATVLVMSVITAFAWQLFGPPGAWFEPTLAVLVVACPCALALALPAASTAAHAGLLHVGVAVLSPRALERVAAIDHVVFDKTGTLTCGEFTLRSVTTFGGTDSARVLALARALATLSNHPLARAVAGGECEHASIVDGQVDAGRGICGVWEGERVAFGSRTFIVECFPHHVLPASSDDTCSEAWVASTVGVLGRLEFDDKPRPHAGRLVSWLRREGITVSIASGDRIPAVRALAHVLGMRDWYAALTPRAKLDHVSALQARGERVAVVGDGVNDAPILAKADVSFAVADSSAAARQQADILLLRPDLLLIARVFESARAWKRVAKQNSMWALAYNGLAIPAAACGLLPPWLAALGMSVSSLIVVVNALRLCGTRCSWT